MREKLSSNAITVLERRYLTKNEKEEIIESPDQLFRRVGTAIASAEVEEGRAKWAKEFYTVMRDLDFLPNSPTLMNAGTENGGTYSGCFVVPIDDSMEGIMKAATTSAMIQKFGGGVGVAFSRLRHKNAKIRSTHGKACGIIKVLGVLSAVSDMVTQGGKRDGANMGCLDISHPQILEFLSCKQEEGIYSNFNLSVVVTDKFMDALQEGADWELLRPGTDQVVAKVPAKEIWDKIVVGAHRNGEPGVIFIDEINRKHPCNHIAKIEATNPCGEQPLLPNESCNLGSINVSNFYVEKTNTIDWDRLQKVVAIAIRFLDDVISVNNFPLEEVKESTMSTRKVGLGIMGWADLLIKLGIPYDSEDGINLAMQLMETIQRAADRTSEELGVEKGNFPAWKGSVYSKENRPMRNATRTTLAPTGTISIIADCSQGMEPLYALRYVRNVMSGTQLVEMNELFEKAALANRLSRDIVDEVLKTGTLRGVQGAPADLQRVFVTALDIDPVWHVRMQAAFQQFVDNAVSKTINLPNSATIEEVDKLYRLAYSLGCKGTTLYRDGSRDEQVFTIKVEEKPEEEQEPVGRPLSLVGCTEKIKTGCGNLYVTINEHGDAVVEVFAHIGKSGGCSASQMEANGRLISMCLRSKAVALTEVIKQLRGISCSSPEKFGADGPVLSCADGIAVALQRYLDRKNGDEPSRRKLMLKMGSCPDCGAEIEYQSGCATCRACGYSKCG